MTQRRIQLWAYIFFTFSLGIAFSKLSVTLIKSSWGFELRICNSQDQFLRQSYDDIWPMWSIKTISKKCLLPHFAILAPKRYNLLCYEPPWIKNIFIHINMQYNSISSFSPPLLDCFLGPVVHISGGYKVQIPGVVPRMPCSKSLSLPCGTTQGLLCWCWQQYGCCTSCLLYSDSSLTSC